MIKNKNVINITFLAIIFMCTGEVIKISFIPVYGYILALAIGVYMILLFDNRLSKKIKINKLLVLSITWIIYGFILMLLADIHYTYKFYISIASDLLIIILIVLTATEKKTILYYCKAVVIGHLLSILASIYELQTGNHLVKLSEEYIRIYGTNIFGFQVNINDNVTALLMGMFALLILIAENKRYILWKCIALLITIYLILKIGSRSGYMSLVVCGTVIIYLNLIYKFIHNNKTKMFLNFVFISFMLLGLIGIFYDNTLLSVLENVFGGNDYYSDLQRLTIIKDTFQLGYKRLFLGLGPGVSTLMVGINPHLLFLEILVDYGFIILILFLKVLFEILKINFFSINKFTKSIIVSFIIGFIAISIASSSIIRIRIAWIMLAIIYSLYKCYANLEKII